MQQQPVVLCNRRALLGGIISTAFSAGAFAQEAHQSGLQKILSGGGDALRAASAAIPPDVIAKIKAAPNRQIFNVSASEVYADAVLKCEEIVLSQDASLTLPALTSSGSSFVAICARRWKFLAPQKRAIIKRDLTAGAIAGNVGGTGASGGDGPYDDTPGYTGGQGANGGTGGTTKIVPLYLFGEKTIDQPGNPIPWMNLVILLPGVMGGTGGTGGIGGRGGNGASGHPGSDSAFDCKRGPGDGGDGGRGGTGGPGGSGGVGGDGGIVTYAGPQPFLDIITFANLVNVPGEGGLGGNGGRGGQGGSGGPRGSNTFYCHGGRPGHDGGPGTFGADGAWGALGQKGFADISLRSNLNDCY
ncbi:MAG: hypothetical protein V4472_02610 [Pseudomonadota bacterium]